MAGGQWPVASFEPGRYNDIPVLELLHAAARGWVSVDRRLLRSILDRGETAVPGIVAFAHEPHEQDRVDLDLVLTDLFRHYRNPEGLEFFVDLVRRDPEDVDDSLIQALLPFGDQAIAPLLRLYEETGEERASDIAFLLAGLRVRDPRVLALLLERLEFDAADGAFCLGLYGDPAARPAMEKILAEIQEEDVELRREIVFALEQIDTPQPPYSPESFDIYAEYPARELPEFDVLPEGERIEFLASADAQIRAGAAHSFFNASLHPKARAALRELAGSDPDPNVRGRAWESLSDVVEEESVRSAMMAVLEDAGRPVEERGGAAVGLYGVVDRAEVQRSIEALYEEGGAARAKALECMWRSLHKPFAKYFAPHLDDPDRAIRRQALRGAGYFRLTGYADKIATYFDDDRLRDDALFAYALAMPGETTRGRVRGMLRKIDSLTHLSPAEIRLVRFGLDERLRLHGLDPVFEIESGEEEYEEPEQPAPPPAKVGRNDPCPCGSGLKYKKCHGK